MMIVTAFTVSFASICLLSLLQDGVVSGDCAAEGEAVVQSGSVYCHRRSCRFTPNYLDWTRAQAVGTFRESLMSTGWGILDISAGRSAEKNHTDDDVMYAAGYLEGFLTARQMENHYTNMYKFSFPKPEDKKLAQKINQWFVTQRTWADSMIRNNVGVVFWRHASYIFAQLDGLYAGYRAAETRSTTPLDRFAISFLNNIGDTFELIRKLKGSFIEDWTKMTLQDVENYINRNGHCSVLIKLLPGYENIYMGHSSWFTYGGMNRIFKHYNLNVADLYTAARKMSFSSYPGLLQSLDDFYMMDSGLMMLQTTNAIFRRKLFEYITPQSLLAWQRVRIANMLARNGRAWTELLSSYNSGTYNNQYMILDLNLIKLKSTIPDNTLWIAEQIPDLVISRDVTSILRAGYFPSYNIPFFEEIYNKSGYDIIASTYGREYNYQLSSRAKIFRRDQTNVKDLQTMKALMRSNEYMNDPYSNGDAMKAICSRPDLKRTSPDVNGCYDTKVADFQMAKNFQAHIINGPTLGTRLPPFSWSSQFANVSHVGLPLIYNFPFIQTQPSF